MNLEEILIQTLNREASSFQVPPSFQRELKKALEELESTPRVSLSAEAIESLKQDTLKYWRLVGQPVF